MVIMQVFIVIHQILHIKLGAIVLEIIDLLILNSYYRPLRPSQTLCDCKKCRKNLCLSNPIRHVCS
jgi:hypothetical protein